MKQRPLFLTIWLTFLSIGALVASILYFLNLLSHNMTNGLFFTIFGVLGITRVLQIIAIYLLWRWIDFGFYLAIICFLLDSVVGILFFHINPLVLLGLTTFVILRLAMRPVQNQFD